MAEGLDFGILDKIIKETTAVIESSKSNLFDIAETAKGVQKKMQEDYDRVCADVRKVIEKVDKLEVVYKRSRLRLIEVSRDFKKYTEDDIREAYQRAQELQVQLAVERERENGLRLKREEISRSIVRVGGMVNQAEELVSKVDLALTYLSGNLAEFGQQMEGVQQKQLIGGRIILAQEEERKRVAREIHDGPAQTMANVVLRAEICEKLLQSNRDEVVEELKNLKQTVKESLREVRRIIFNLRPMTLDDLGLIPTLKRFLEELREREGYIVHFEFHGEDKRLINTYEVALFRLVQEAVNNAKKYAQAERIAVRVDFTQSLIKVAIRDNGKGFDLEKIRSENTGKESFGLLSMKERIELLNGVLQIKTGFGKGTAIEVELPMEEALSK